MSKYRIIFLSLLGLFSVLLQTGRASYAEEIRIAYPPIVASLPLFIAEDQGLFEMAGIQVKKVSFTSSNDMVNALVSGEIDMLPAVSLIPILQLELRYPGTVRVFSHSRMRPDRAFDSIVVRETSDIGDLTDLEGKKIGAFPGTSATRMLQAFLEKHGIAANAITFVPLAPPTQLGSLESGAVDALFSYEPITTAAALHGGFRQLFGSVYADLIDPSPIGASVVSRSFEKSNPQLVKKVIEVIDESVTYMRDHPEDAKELLSRFASIQLALARQVNVVDVTLSGEVDVDNLQRFIELLIEVGELDGPLRAEMLIGGQQP